LHPLAKTWCADTNTSHRRRARLSLVPTCGLAPLWRIHFPFKDLPPQPPQTLAARAVPVPAADTLGSTLASASPGSLLPCEPQRRVRRTAEPGIGKRSQRTEAAQPSSTVSCWCRSTAGRQRGFVAGGQHLAPAREQLGNVGRQLAFSLEAIRGHGSRLVVFAGRKKLFRSRQRVLHLPSPPLPPVLPESLPHGLLLICEAFKCHDSYDRETDHELKRTTNFFEQRQVFGVTRSEICSQS